MSVLSLCLEPDAVLRRPARRITAVNDAIKQLIRDMIETMYANDGIGLAAPQVGQPLQLFIANPSQQQGRELVVINPVLEALRGRAGIVEGCLSVPKVWEHVRRSASVRLRGLDADGRPLAIDADGLLAIVLQHETDHLRGRLFIDRLSWWRRRRVARQRRTLACA